MDWELEFGSWELTRFSLLVVLALHRTPGMKVSFCDLGLAVLACSFGAVLQKVPGLSTRQRRLSLRQANVMDRRNALDVQAVLADHVTETVGPMLPVEGSRDEVTLHQEPF